MKKKLFNLSEFFDSQVRVDGDRDISIDNSLFSSYSCDPCSSSEAQQDSFMNGAPVFTEHPHCINYVRNESPEVKVSALNLNVLATKYVDQGEERPKKRRRRMGERERGERRCLG